MGERSITSHVSNSAERLRMALGSKRCFYLVLGIFAAQALWFAFTARYPMAFDEDFHFGLIQLHAHQWLPFFTSQPAGADQFGSVVRDPSYFYHFLMSLPYRLITLVTSNTILQIILLRCINIAFAIASLVLARQLLRRLGGSAALANSALLLFALIPIVPFLAAHINYDNLFILLVLWSILATFDWLDRLAKRKISAANTILILSLFAIASLVKYAYLPIAVVLGVIMLWQLWRQRHAWTKLRMSFTQSARSLQWWQAGVIGLVLLLSGGLFAERYAVNVIRYHAPNPDCGQVLSVQNCLQYGPWARDYQLTQAKPADVHPSKVAYIWEWLYGMWLRSFFAISDTYDTQPPLPVPGGTVIVIGIVGLAAFAYFGRRLLQGNIYRQTVVLTLTLYIGALFIQTFQSYLKTGEPVAINGRYLLPFLPMIILLVGLAYSKLWRKQPALKAAALTIVIMLFIQGGGILTFLLRSNDNWYWPNNAVVAINRTVREALKPLVIGAKL